MSNRSMIDIFQFFQFVFFWHGIDNSGDKAPTLTTKVADHPRRAWGEEGSGWDLNSHRAGLATRKGTPLSDWGSPLILWFLCFSLCVLLTWFLHCLRVSHTCYSCVTLLSFDGVKNQSSSARLSKSSTLHLIRNAHKKKQVLGVWCSSWEHNAMPLGLN